MRIVDDGTGRSFVYAATLHAHQTILYDVTDAHAVADTNFIQFFYQSRRTEFFAVYGYRDPCFKFQLQQLFLIRRCLRGVGHLEQFRLGCIPGIFQIRSFMGKMPHVTVHGIVIAVRYRDGNIVSRRIIDFLVAGAQFPFPPGGDDRQIRIQRFHA